MCHRGHSPAGSLRHRPARSSAVRCPAGPRTRPPAPAPAHPCCNPTLYGCGLCSPTHCSDVLPDSVDPDTASSVRAIMNWRCEMIYSPHGPVMYGPANMPLGPKRVPTAYQSHLNVISLLHPGPGPDRPLTRIRGLELMSTRAFHPARGQTPLLRADVTPISRYLLDRSHSPSEA